MNKEELKYSKEHEWVKLDGDTATVGITDFAQNQLTDIVFVELPEKGKHATQNKEVAVVESVKSVSDIFAPVSGEIAEVNDKVKDSPEMINKDPYGEGWLIKIRLEDKEELKSLMSHDDYEKFISSKGGN
mgnify:CR=1 FL=1